MLLLPIYAVATPQGLSRYASDDLLLSVDGSPCQCEVPALFALLVAFLILFGLIGFAGSCEPSR